MRQWFSASCAITVVLRGFAGLALTLCACMPRMALSQTPLPMQEWQFSHAATMAKVFQPNVPEWQVANNALLAKPLYDGAAPYRVLATP